MTLFDVRKCSNPWKLEIKFESYEVKVLKIDSEKRKIYASWNHNNPVWFNEKTATKLRATEPKE